MNPDLDDGASSTVPPDSPQNRLLAMEERLNELTQLVAALKGPEQGLDFRPPSPTDGMHPAQAGHPGVVPSYKDIRTLIPSFTGLDRHQTVAFLEKVRFAFDLANRSGSYLPHAVKIDLIASKLQSLAWQHWHSLRPDHPARLDADALLEELQAQFGPVNAQYTAALQLLDCRQRGHPVERHTATFIRLLKDLPEISSEARSCLYLATLDKDLAALLLANTKPTTDLASLSALAGTLHMTLHRPRPSQVGPSAPPSTKHSRSGPKPFDGTPAQQKFLTGSFKSLPDGWSPQSFAAPLRTANFQMQKWLEHNRLCLKCRQEGHTSESCPVQTKN